MNTDGSGQRNLTRRPVDYGGNDQGPSPAWSPDGRKIAFDRGRGIFVMNADGSGQRRLTQFGLVALWSPDGRMIAFRSSGAGNVDIFVMNADGSGQRNLTRTPRADEIQVCLVAKVELVKPKPRRFAGRGGTFEGLRPERRWQRAEEADA